MIAIEFTDRLLNQNDINQLNTLSASLDAIESSVYSPNNNIIYFKLSDSQKKFSHYDEFLKYFHEVFSRHTYVILNDLHAEEIYEKYRHPEANIQKINIK